MRRGARRGSQSRLRTAVAAFAVPLGLAGCAPAPAPGPSWTSTRVPRTVSSTEVVNRYGAWTDGAWFATVRVVTPLGLAGGTTATLDVQPRVGPTGAQLGPVQAVPLSADVGFGGPLGEHVVALPGTAPYGEPSTVAFFRPVDGVWGPAGTASVPAGFQVTAMTDEWMVARRVPGDPSASGDGQVLVFSVDTSGPAVSAALSATLGPDPSWPAALREGFGNSVALDGGLLAVGAIGLSAPTPGAVRVFRAGPGGWTPAESLGGTTEPAAFGRSLAVDDGVVDRLVVGPLGTSVDSLAIDVMVDDGTGFALEQRIDRDPSPVDLSSGGYFAAATAIDGPTLAFTTRTSSVPSADPLHLAVTVGHVALFRRDASWTREAEIDLFPTPFDAGVRSALPARLQMSGEHVAASLWVTPDEPPGCVFPCFVLGFEAWSLDRI